MKKITIVILLIGILMLVTACKREGRLRIYNNSGEPTTVTIEDEEYDIDARNTLIREWNLRYSVFRVEEKTIRCEIFPRLFLFGERFAVVVTAGSTTNRTISDNAAGLEIKNDSHAFDITHVYVSPSTSHHWGDNKLTEPLPPGYYQQWNLSEGAWDIRVVDSMGDDYVAFNQKFVVGRLNTYTYSGFDRVRNADEEKRKRAKGIRSEDQRVEKIQ